MEAANLLNISRKTSQTYSSFCDKNKSDICKFKNKVKFTNCQTNSPRDCDSFIPLYIVSNKPLKTFLYIN